MTRQRERLATVALQQTAAMEMKPGPSNPVKIEKAIVLSDKRVLREEVWNPSRRLKV
jgi:hypothetical protein